MKYGIESFTGIRPTADLTVANYIGAVKPILDQETDGHDSAIFLAELHAATTNRPAEVMQHSHELTRTLIASGVRGEIYSQRDAQDLVSEVEMSLRGLTTVSRLLRLPTLKEKVQQSDNTENANVALAMYPMMMAADIVLARPAEVPTGKDQKPHLEITNELIRSFNREYDADLPEPQMREVTLPNILSLDASGRKMSKSYPKGAVFLNDVPEIGRRKIMKAVTASEPGPEMDVAIDNLLSIANGLSSDEDALGEVAQIGEDIKSGERRMKEFKENIGDIVVGFLVDINDKRDSISDEEVRVRIAQGNEWFRPIGEETAAYVRDRYWNVPTLTKS